MSEQLDVVLKANHKLDGLFSKHSITELYDHIILLMVFDKRLRYITS